MSRPTIELTSTKKNYIIKRHHVINERLKTRNEGLLQLVRKLKYVVRQN